MASGFAGGLPRHARLIAELREVMVADDRWRWFSVGCSLGSGRGDELSDIDCGAGFAEPFDVDDLELAGRELVTSVGEVTDVLVHLWEGMPTDTRRFAVEYTDLPQLDLVVLPASRMPGLRDGEVAIVDKDGTLARAATSALHGPPGAGVAREWTLMAWWWVSRHRRSTCTAGRSTKWRTASHGCVTLRYGLRCPVGRAVPVVRARYWSCGGAAGPYRRDILTSGSLTVCRSCAAWLPNEVPASGCRRGVARKRRERRTLESDMPASVLTSATKRRQRWRS